VNLNHVAVSCLDGGSGLEREELYFLQRLLGKSSPAGAQTDSHVGQENWSRKASYGRDS